jgi:hypothetical protein
MMAMVQVRAPSAGRSTTGESWPRQVALGSVALVETAVVGRRLPRLLVDQQHRPCLVGTTA